MFSRQSPVKRKHCEYHDPDYPQDNSQRDQHELPNSSNNAFPKKQKLDESVSEEKFAERKIYLEKIKDVVEREFNRELAFKQQQLEIIHERVEGAKELLDKLRYALVASYYKHQDLPLAAADSTTLKGSRDEKGPQIQIHPSLKKLIGKKPKNLSDVIRSCPKRTAAQNAVQTIRAKSDVQKREERKLKQIIRGQGIVIDHSVEKETKTDLTNLLNAAKRSQNQGVQVRPVDRGKTKQKTGKPLVGTRLNNKIKHLIVVGNTSKSIVGEQDTDTRNNSQMLTHKWLVYVQAKELEVPIERFVKKIRFHLHHSYRPNDIVDVVQPPFHVARRGWGEFPIRVQLFFHDEYYQKPVQLVHNVILDKTLSGIQTLGAETLLEVWLRNVPQKEEIKLESTVIDKSTKVPQQSKQRGISRSEQLVDDLLDFLNKIEATHSSISADIEKIEPTVVVAEPLSVKTSSPVKAESMSMLGSAPLHRSDKSGGEKNIFTPHDNVANNAMTNGNSMMGKHIGNLAVNPKEIHVKHQEEFQKEDTKTIPSSAISAETSNLQRPLSSSNPSAVTKPKTTFIKLPQNSPFIRIINNANAPNNSIRTTSTSIIPQTSTNNTSVIVNKIGKIVMPVNSASSAVSRTTLPVVARSSATLDNVNTHKATTIPSNGTKQILQKKLVQLVDASGKVKYMQMLVAASSSTTTPTTVTKGHESSMASMAPKLSSLISGCKSSFTISNTKPISRPHSATPLRLSNSNSSSLMPAGITMKPNIFKIIPENMHTKPQIVTFCTGFSTTTTTTITTVTSTAALPNINRNTTIGSNPGHFTPSIQQPKPSNGGSMPRNLVFQKEGKVYIIDPLQTKLKQQQKKQVSLLKPQVSLLKQQMMQRKQQESSSQAKGEPEHQQNVVATSVSSVSVRNNVPQIHFGLKQQRLNTINALQLMQMKKILFEKQFLKQQFGNMRSAVDFLLRRLRLVVHKDSLAGVYPFVTHSTVEFQSLTAFKQRAYEWLRAKQISRLIRSHKDLQRINTNQQETFWTTKEIALFARQYAYTPEIKSLPKLVENSFEMALNFNDIVKSQLNQKLCATFDTLTNHKVLFRWVDKVWPILDDHEQIADQNQFIDVDLLRDETTEVKRHKVKPGLSYFNSVGSSSSENYLSLPSKLETECSLVKEICRNLNVSLEPEELVPNVWHASTQTVLAQCLQIFLQKLIRNAIANKKQTLNARNELVHNIQPTDIAKVLSTSEEFDFLTNRNFGSLSNTDPSDGYLVPIIKQEKS